MKWESLPLILPNGETVSAQAPVIISVSRATDIPAFYADWFVERCKAGYVRWCNPFNGTSTYLSFEKVRAAVFWSKNPSPMMQHLAYLQERIPNFYFQFSLNDYEREGYEPHLPSLADRINTFKELSEKIGRERVIWRNDPLLLTEEVDVRELLNRVKNIGDQIHQHTAKLVFSFADISGYPKVSRNLLRQTVKYIEFTNETMCEFAVGLQEINRDWGLQLATCVESISLESFGITHNKCVDDDLLARLFPEDESLMAFLGAKPQPATLFDTDTRLIISQNNKDKGQRAQCQCANSKDIGQYDTCPHGCVYCYANSSYSSALRNFERHNESPNSESIV